MLLANDMQIINSKGPRTEPLFIDNVSDFLPSMSTYCLWGNFQANGCSYVNIDNEALDNYIKLLLQMYADDTILIADS